MDSKKQQLFLITDKSILYKYFRRGCFQRLRETYTVLFHGHDALFSARDDIWRGISSSNLHYTS